MVNRGKLNMLALAAENSHFMGSCRQKYQTKNYRRYSRLDLSNAKGTIRVVFAVIVRVVWKNHSEKQDQKQHKTNRKRTRVFLP